MLSIHAEFLTGRYVATDPYGHDEPEWPPHPGRLFASMAAAYFEGGKSDGERDALEWLESCGPPDISYDNKAVFQRETVYYFVPVNDKDKYITAGQVPLGTTDLGAGRLRKERSFPTTITGRGPVTFAWGGVDAGSHKNPLRAICARVHRLGHSSSFVHLTVGEDAQGAGPSLIPSRHGAQKIRWISPGTLSRFEGAYDVGDVKNVQERPYFARKARLNAITLPPVLYAPPQGGPGRVPSGQFAGMHVFEVVNGPRLGLVYARAISRAVKSRLVATVADAEAVSGLGADGQPTTKPHVSIVPLAFVGRRHADGGVRGIAVAVPRGMDESTASSVLRSMQGDGRGIPDGSRPALSLNVQGHDPLELALCTGDVMETLDPTTWAGMSRTWSSVTPVVLDRAPRAQGDARDAEVSGIISRSCTLQGLPAPVSVATSNVPYVRGPPLSSNFPLYTLPVRSGPTTDASGRKPAAGKGKMVARVHTHARITFGEAVCGPLILGAGRYNGYGLCIPSRGDQ